MKIYNSSGVEIVNVIVKDDSYRYRTIMGENALTLKFDSFTHIDIPVGSYCDFQGERYTLMRPQNIIEHNTRNFEYTLILESAFSLLGLYKFKDTASSRLKFSLTEKPQMFLQRLVENLNTRDSGWSVGSYVDSPEKTLSFNHNYCSEALKMIADAFETEFEVVGKVIHLRKVEYNKTTPLALSYGKGNGFKSGLKRDNFDNSKVVEILYIQGGERNIDRSKYGSQELLLPKNASLEYEGRNYISDPLGYFIVNADRPLSSKSEDSLDCTHIYPSRVGEVSEVIAVDAEKNFYDFKDSSIPESLDYSLCRIAGEKAIVKFESGMLAGKEFDIMQTDSALTGYVHAERRFKLVPQEIDGVTMPNEVFKPAIGDKYAVFGIHLPDAYIEDTEIGAEWKMFREAAKYMHENEDPRFSFTGPLDGIWAKQNWLAIGGKIKLGGYVSFTAEFQTTPVLIRIVGIKDYINKPYSPEIELSNVTVGAGFATSLRKLEATEVVIDESKKESIRFAKRGFREARETSKMLENALLNFSGSINPISVQTMQILLGDESLQFDFVASSSSKAAIPHNESFDSSTKIFTSDAGVIMHKTLGVDSLSSSHPASAYKWWAMDEYVSPALVESEKSYYLYAKVSKIDNTGSFLLSEDAIAMEQLAGYYHLFVGILNSEFDGNRSYSPMYGYAELGPGRFTVKKVVSPTGGCYFDLNANDGDGEIGGNIKFKSGSTYTDVGAGIAGAIATAAADATAKANAAQAAAEALANEAWDYADEANANAMDAIDSANTANTLLSNIANDNKLTPDEKQSTKKEWDIIVAEYTPILNQGTAFGITTEKTAFTTKYNALGTYITPLLSSLTTTSDITGSVFRSTFAEYYTAKVNLLNAISAKAKQLADNAQADADQAWAYADDVQNELNGLQVGGENIADRTEIAIVAGSENSKFDFIKGNLSSTPVSGSYLKNNQAHVLTISESIRTAGTATHYSVVLFDFTQLINTYQQEFAFSTSKRVIKFTTPATGNWSLLIYAGIAGATAGNSVEYKGIMLQEGNRETAYQSAVKYLTQAIHGSTEISGGLVATNIMLLKNALNEITGGLSGIDDDNIGFWTGGTYADALAGLAKIILRKDGTAHLVNAYLKGVIEATAGKIGGLNISGNSLVSDTMAFTETAVESLANLITPLTASMSSQSSWSQSGTFLIEANTQNLAISFDSVLKFRASTTAGGISTSWELIIKNSSGETVYMNSGTGQLSTTLFSVNLPTGTYAIFLSSRGRKAQDSDPAPAVSATIQGESASPGTIWAYGYQNRTKIGNNGLYSFWAAANYLYYSASAGLHYKGEMNIPGVLAAGVVNSDGVQDTNKAWGAKKNTNNASRTGGIYTVPHSVGHSNFTVQATSHTPTRIAFVTGRTSTTFTIQVRDNNNAEQQSGFDYLIIGNN